MASKYYFLNLVVGILTIVITSLGIGLSFFYYGSILTGSILLFILFIETVLLINFLNGINRKIGVFFNAIKNYETSIKAILPEKNKSLYEIQKGLARVIETFQKTKIENEIREQLLMSMIEHSSTGFLSIDSHGDFEIMNQTSRNLLGVDYTSNMERLKIELPELYKTLSELKPGNADSCQISNASGIQIIKVSMSELSFKNKTLKLVSLQDIKNEVETRELQSWQKLIRIMNHEIMNSIAPITSVSKSLLPIFIKGDKPITPADLNEQKICDTINGLEVIDSMSAGLNNFVAQYRKLSQIPEPVMVPITCSKWIESIKTICNADIKKNNAQLVAKDNSYNHEFNADEGLLNQVVLNLIKNAAEAPIADKNKIIKLVISDTLDNKTDITISNNGVPIPIDIQDKIFVPFFTTKESGSGIGLFLSRQIINLHKGSISLFTNSNKETVFKISL